MVYSIPIRYGRIEEMTNKRPYRNVLTGRVAYMYPRAAGYFTGFTEVRNDKPEVLQSPERRAEIYEGLTEDLVQDVQPEPTIEEGN